MTNLQQAYLDLLPFSDCTTVTLRAATGQEGGETGVEGHEKKVTYCFLTHLVSYKVCLLARFMEIQHFFANKDFDEF